jgi:leucyl-tRNA synthetase
LVKTVVREGKVIVVDFDEKNITFAQEFRAALAQATARFEQKFGEDLVKYKKGEWLKERNKWWQIRSAEMLLKKISNYKMHKKRIEELSNFLVEQMKSDHETSQLTTMLES